MSMIFKEKASPLPIPGEMVQAAFNKVTSNGGSWGVISCSYSTIPAGSTIPSRSGIIPPTLKGGKFRKKVLPLPALIYRGLYKPHKELCIAELPDKNTISNLLNS